MLPKETLSIDLDTKRLSSVFGLDFDIFPRKTHSP